MSRNILVNVRPAAQSSGPIVVVLDGLEASVGSGWLHDDPAMGRQK